MSRSLRLLSFPLLLAAFSAGEVAAQLVSVVPNVGISKDMRSETSNRWNLGFNAGVNVFIGLPGTISLGGRVAYHSWGADGEGWAKDYAEGSGYNYNITSSSGTQSVIEIVPSMKIALTPGISPIRLDVQLGAGLFLVSPGDVKIEGTFSAPGSSGSGSVTFMNESLTGYGIQAGLPLTIAGRLQVLPLYSLYWAGGDAYHHITLNAGIVL